MPMINFKAIATDDVLKASKNMLDDLQSILQCPRDSLHLEVTQSVYVADGEPAKGMPLVEVLWFERPEDLQKKTADLLVKYVQDMGYQHVEIIFRNIEKDKFYKV
ncbi:DUF1904 family protein [Parasporobacterium paucivorans]|uniref:DUF1904 family protein n=1 Tax=Parasporobacterium paucivorans DSM 15970 TaxID=1122934 RepID=A0A1M6JI14_9FIRM|nr:DUF1904 family protein [Parasporobacterium paucivorans]SHJ46349.1 protein of unknown function [Parasporobacterium paucivorans DSM 15970]